MRAVNSRFLATHIVCCIWSNSIESTRMCYSWALPALFPCILRSAMSPPTCYFHQRLWAAGSCRPSPRKEHAIALNKSPNVTFFPSFPCVSDVIVRWNTSLSLLIGSSCCCFPSWMLSFLLESPSDTPGLKKTNKQQFLKRRSHSFLWRFSSLLEGGVPAYHGGIKNQTVLDDRLRSG